MRCRRASRQFSSSTARSQNHNRSVAFGGLGRRVFRAPLNSDGQGVNVLVTRCHCGRCAITRKRAALVGEVFLRMTSDRPLFDSGLGRPYDQLGIGDWPDTQHCGVRTSFDKVEMLWRCSMTLPRP